MKKTKLLAAILAGTMMFTGVPYVAEPLTVVSEAASSKLAAPTGFKAASTTETSIKLTWNKVNKADAYRIYMYNSKTDEYETYKNVSGTSFTVKSLKKGTTYKFKIAALVKSGKKYVAQTKSSSISVTTDEKKLPAPTNITYSSTNSSVKLSWNAVSGADAYRVYKYNGNTYETYKNVSGTSCDVTGLKEKATYKFKIAALVKSGNGYKEQTKSAVITTTTKQTQKTSVVTRSNIKVTFNNKYHFEYLDNRFNEYHGKPFICYSITLENIGTTIEPAFSYNDYDIYGSKGIELPDTMNHYAGVMNLSDLESYYKRIEHDNLRMINLRPGAKLETELFFPYDGDGDYYIVIHTDKNDYEKTKEVKLSIKR